VPGANSTIYWWSHDGSIARLTLASPDLKAETTVQVTLPAPAPIPNIQILTAMRTQVVGVTDDGYLLSRIEYHNDLAFGIPNTLYFAGKNGDVKRLGPIAANTVAAQYLSAPAGGGILYAANDHVNNACGKGVLGVVAANGADAATVDLPASDCSVIVNMWNDPQRGGTFILLNRWKEHPSSGTDHGDMLLKYGDRAVTDAGLPPVRESASNRQWTAEIAREQRSSTDLCGALTLKSAAKTVALDSNVCMVAATPDSS
jgi:hypothetical protein